MPSSRAGSSWSVGLSVRWVDGKIPGAGGEVIAPGVEMGLINLIESDGPLGTTYS